MMSLFGGSGPSPEEITRENAVKLSMTNHLRVAVKNLQKLHVNSEEPIRSEDTANSVCNVLEAIFLHGLKPSISKKLSGFLGGTQDPSEMSYWDFVTKFSHRDVVSQLNHLGQITTQIGMCRAWLRLAMNDSLLESYLTAMLRDGRALRTYYRRTAYLRDLEQPTIMVTYIQGLCEFSFELSYNSSVLNMWSSSALSLAGLVHVQVITPQPVISPTTAEEAIPDASPPHRTSAMHHSAHRGTCGPSKTRVVNTIGYTDSTLTQLMTPPVTPFDPSHIPPSEIEHIRKMIEARYSGSESSTATSQISHPDDTDQRMFPQMCISPKASAMGEEYLASCRDSGLGADVMSNGSLIAVPGVVRGKIRTKIGKKKKVKKKKEKISDKVSDKLSQSTEEFVQNSTVSDTQNMDKQNVDKLQTDHQNTSAIPDQSRASILADDNSSLSNDFVRARTNISIDASQSQSTLINTESTTSTLKPDEPSQTIPADSGQSQVTEQTEPVAETPEQTAAEVSDNEEIIHSIYSSEDVKPGREAEDNIAEGGRGEDKAVGVGEKDFRYSGSEQMMRHLRPAQKSMAPPELSIITATANGVEEAHEADKDVHSPHDEYGGFVSGEVEVVRPIDHPGLDAPRGNSLSQGLMLGWSSEFDEQPNMYDVTDTGYSNDYIPAPIGGVRTNYMTPERKRLANERAVASLSEQTSSPGRDSAQGAGSFDDFEILTDDDNDIQLEQARLESFKELMCEIQHERGLDFHNFQCKACKRPVGLFFCNPRVCSYDGGYYCYECHENNEYYIPARILHNWDFQKYPVSGANLVLLRQFEESPLVDVNSVNPRLYDHVKEMHEAKMLRTQLRFLKAYLFTCKQSVADEFRRQVLPKEYLYDHIHVYSLLDLLQIPSGQFGTCLKKLIRFATRHVYDCRLCSGKGFICEICDNPKVIYPFEMDSTYRCTSCEAVYHAACKTSMVTCPKCKRIMERNMKLGKTCNSSLDNDYSMSMHL